MRPPALALLALVTALVCSLRAGGAPAEAREDDASAAVTLLRARCTECHGGERQRGGLRLDRAEGLSLVADSGLVAVLPGEPEASELLRRVQSDDPGERMPRKGAPLEEAEVELLERWISAGAPWPVEEDVREESSHWAYRPVVRPVPPGVRAEERVRNPVDRFVLARLEAEGIEPAPEADRETLIRRLSLDLTGLPPTPEEVAAFRADEEAGAYERLVERLLASPHYGERQARHWLDQARYSDSHGYTFDGARSIWPWRDWVIRAFNEDMPFDRFTIEQLAGDLLPEPTLDQLVATGFHRNTQINEENGVDAEEDRIEAVKDRVDTTGEVWLGSTLHCAQCHSHKYDPFTQRDYYRFFAFFDQTEDLGGFRAAVRGPRLELPTPEEAAAIERNEEQVAELRAELARRATTRDEVFVDWERDYLSSVRDWTLLVPRETSTTSADKITVEEDGAIRMRGGRPDSATYVVVADAPLPRVTAVRLEVLPGPALGRAADGTFVLSEFRLSGGPAAEGAARVPLKIARTEASYYQHFPYRKGARRGAIGLEQEPYREELWPPEATLDGDAETGWAVAPHTGIPQVIVYELDQPLEFEEGARLAFTLAQELGEERTIARFRLWATGIDPPVAGTYTANRRIVNILGFPPEERNEDQLDYLQRYFVERAVGLLPERMAIERLGQERPQPATTLVMNKVRRPRTTRLLVRGSFLDPGPVVDPGVPGFLPPLDVRGETADRLDLARWLVAPENPLTHRVFVNRAWQQLFGIGLVETDGDFGTRGSEPTHPELLDWLAAEFVARGQRPKELLRLLVGSATYRQASPPRPELSELDPRNRLLARQARLRFDAEVIRDSALVASGLFTPTVYGPPVFPPLPSDVFRFTQKPKPWLESEGPDRYRRTLYTWHWRSSPHPFLTTFDADVGQRSCTRRRRSNTPLQALTLANDPMFLELARGLAVRVLVEAEGELRERLAWAFRRCLVREPTARELDLLEAFHRRQLAAFRSSEDAGLRFAPTGLPRAVEPALAAAWAATARVLLNLDEFVTRG